MDNLAGEIPQLNLDRQRIHEALWNLLNNALQAMPQGGRLEVGARYNPSSGEVSIQVSDTGDGIGSAPGPQDHPGPRGDHRS
jgi:signal transduction histidine kinase